MPLELYHHDMSTCSQKVRICLAEKGIDWVSRPVDIANHENLSPDYLAINPNGVVPAFVHDGVPIIESSVMCEYVEEVWPDPPALSPGGAKERAGMRGWLRYIDEVPSMAVRVPSFQKVLLPKFQAMSEEAFAEFRDRNPLRRDFFMRMGRSGFSDSEYESALHQLSSAIERMEKTLANEGPWLMGAQYTIADICVVPIIQRLEDLEMADLWENAPAVTDWLARMRARPAYAEAFYEGSLLNLAKFREAQAAQQAQP